MDTLQALSLAMGTAWTSGINLYATVAALGIAGRTEMIQLPPDLQVLTHPAVIAVACVMYLIEFFADKVPYAAGAILAARTLGDVNPALELAAVLAGGTIAFAAHGTKMATRLALNVSPEPFSNWFASIAEDLAVFGSIWLIFHHPILMLILIVCFLTLVVWLVPKLLRLAKRGFQALRDRLRGVKPDQPAPTGSPQLG